MARTMKIRPPGAVTSAALLIAVGATVGVMISRRSPSAKTALACDGEYADSLQLATPRARDLEAQRADYTYLVRSSAKYECPYFGPDGKLRKRRVDAVEHGTGFAYEVSNGETF